MTACVGVFDHVSGKLSALDEAVVQAVPPGGNWRNLPASFPSKRIDQIRASAARGEGSRSTYYGRLRSDRPSYTISTYFNRPGNGCFIHPTADRLITVREAARIQSFPDLYRFAGRGRSRFVQVGNAVPPILAQQIAAQLPAGTVADLFSGAGGLGLGFRLAGHELVASVDFDEDAIQTIHRNGDPNALKADLSDQIQLADVVAEIRHRVGAAGLRTLVGGPPCQGFSTAGKCDLADSRNKLVFAFLEAVAELEPQAAVFENVAALLWRGRRPFLDEVVRQLEHFGYRVAFSLMHAEGFGLPQLRRRVIVVATRGEDYRWPLVTHQLLEPGRPDLQRGERSRTLLPSVTVEEAISDLPVVPSTDPDQPVQYATEPTSDFQQWARSDQTSAEWTRAVAA